MTGRHVILALAASAALAAIAPRAALAQAEPTPFIYASYFQCDNTQAARATEIIRDLWAPVVQTQLAAGNLTAWGLITHHTGGKWQRALYHVGSDRAALMGAMDAMSAEFGSAQPEASAEFSRICPSHEDYIWRYVTGSRPAADVAKARPAAGLSTYWVCDEGREPVADLLVKEVFGPIHDRQVEAGLLNSWSWFAHFMGGKWRRLLVIDGADNESLLEARDAIIAAIGSEQGAMGAEFSRICNGHTDYLWNIAITAP